MNSTDNLVFNKGSQCIIRDAEIGDVQRLAELDLLMFENAYGMEAPDQDDVQDMLRRRIDNIHKIGGAVLVCEVLGEVEGFGSYFTLNKPWEEFTTWEESTNNGTLDGVGEVGGRYAYVVNMTVAPNASAVRGMQKIMVNLIGRGIKNNLDYAYFVSRVPELTAWLSAQGLDYTTMSTDELDKYAANYVDLAEVSSRGIEEPVDYELRTYTRSGFTKGKLVKGGFSDKESLDYGVTFKVDVPLTGKPRAIRSAASKILKFAASSTKLMEKI